MRSVCFRFKERAMAFGRYSRFRATSTILARVISETRTFELVPWRATDKAIRPTPTWAAKAHARPSVVEARRRVYSLESVSVERFPPSTLDHIYIAALSCRILTVEEAIPSARKGSSPRQKAPLSISVGSIDGNDQRATVL